MSISSPYTFWQFIGCRTVTTPETDEVLHRIRRGDPIAAITLDHPQLTQIQIGLARHLQSQEEELNRLYREMQDVERLKMEVERDLATSLLRTMEPPTAST